MSFKMDKSLAFLQLFVLRKELNTRKNTRRPFSYTTIGHLTKWSEILMRVSKLSKFEILEFSSLALYKVPWFKNKYYRIFRILKPYHGDVGLSRRSGLKNPERRIPKIQKISVRKILKSLIYFRRPFSRKFLKNKTGIRDVFIL